MTEGQVVWAKVAGYPWWPAVVTTVSDEGLSVAFLGEKKQYQSSSSFLPPSKVLDFRTHYDRLLSQARGKQKLLHSINLALEMLDEPAPAPPTKRMPSHVKEEEALQLSVTQDWAKEMATVGFPSFPSCALAWLEQLHPADAPSDVLKLMAAVLGENKLGRRAIQLRLQSKLLRLEAGLQPVAYPDLRRRVCRALCRLMTEAGVPTAQAKRRALHEELILRQRDPEMTAEYRRGFQELAQSLRGKVIRRMLRSGDYPGGAL